MDRFEIGAYRMFSGSAEAAKHKYHKYVGKSGRIWLVADIPNAGENVYVEGGPNSDGFGGSELKFELQGSDEIVTLKGPWHSNSEALFEDTGVDVRDRFYTFCVIAKWRDTEIDPINRHYPRTVMNGVLYRDEQPVLGSFDRPEIKKLAKDFANSLQHSVYVYKETRGGSSNVPVDPDGKGFILAPREDRRGHA